MTASKPWLSVLLCTYQGERFLRETLDTVAAQGVDGTEILAVDDGSTDRTRAILASFTDRLPLRILDHERTGNWVRNTNAALRQARGEYVCLLHQDDLWRAGRLARLRALTGAHRDAGMIVHPVDYIDERGRRVGRWAPPFGRRARALPSQFVLERLVVQNAFALPAPLCRRALVETAGGLDEALWFLADWKLWAAVAAQGTVVYTPEVLAGFRLHPASQTVTRSRDAEDLRAQYQSVIEGIAAEFETRTAAHARALAAARLNMDISVALAVTTHGGRGEKRRAVRRLLHTPPGGLYHFLRDARMGQRVVARLRTRLASGGGGT